MKPFYKKTTLILQDIRKGVMVLIFSDENIIEMLFDRDEKALTVTDDKYGPLCRKLAYNIIGDYDEAGECVNNSYFQLWNAIPPARPKSLKAYLCGIVRNLASAISRKKQAYNESHTNFSELAEIFSDSENIEEQLDGKMLGAYINEFLSTQKETNRKIFVMRYYYNYSVRDVSLTLKMKEATVKTNLFRLRAELKRFLNDKGYIT